MQTKSASQLPSSLRQIAEGVGKVKNADFEEIASLTYANAMKVFNLQQMTSDSIFRVSG